MPISQVGSNFVVKSNVAGSVFPTSEREIDFPVLVDGSSEPTQIDGALYGRSLELRGEVLVRGPIVARGDMKLSPKNKIITVLAGLTVNGSLNTDSDHLQTWPIEDGIEKAQVIIKGDIAVNQNVALKNCIVFGSIRATNCFLENTLILGTCIVEESLRVANSSIGGYASRDVTFEGQCVMLHAVGESRGQPLFLPYETSNKLLVASDVRYYPAIRDSYSLMNRVNSPNSTYASYSVLDPRTDWVQATATSNPALDEESGTPINKWILSIGGRICDITKIAEAVSSLTQMLKCGFEFEHYHPKYRESHLQNTLSNLTSEEQWILQKVCC